MAARHVEQTEALAREVEQFRHVRFRLHSTLKGSQVGTIQHDGPTRFRTCTRSSLETTGSNGEAATQEMTVTSVADGESLQVLLPAVLGGAPRWVRVAWSEIETLGPDWSWLQPQLQNPILLAQDLVQSANPVLDEEGKSRLLIHSSRLRDLQFLPQDFSDRDLELRVQEDDAGRLVGLSLSEPELDLYYLRLELTDLPPDAPTEEDPWVLVLPPGTQPMPLSR